MGQKVHPYGFRLGVTKNWRSRWFAKQDYSKLLHEDLELRGMLRKRFKQAGVSDATVQLLIESEGTSRAAGVWRTKDGWIVHTTETRAPGFLPSNEIRADYPLTVYPWIHWGRR